MEKVTNINHYRRRWTFNTGVIIFGIFFLYMVIRVMIFFTESHVTAYEVREGSIVRDTSYTGIAIRDESVFTTDEDGYVNYFTLEGSRVGAQSEVYCLSEKQLDFTNNNQSVSRELSSDEQEELLTRIQTFTENTTDTQFSDIYSLRTDVENVLNSKTSQSRQKQLQEMEESGVELNVYNALADGVILYSTDGYENLTTRDVTAQDISKSEYEVTSLKDNEWISRGDSVYKLVTDDEWSVAVLLDSQTAEELKPLSSVQVRFSKDNETAKASIQIREGAENTIGILTFKTNMIRYVQDRYVDVELILEDQSGLKIPKSSVVEKEFYTLPDDYLTQGGDSSSTGILVEDENGDTVFTTVTVYDRDTESGLVYLDMSDFDEGTIVHRPESEETQTLSEEDTESLQGVYNINKGYTIFLIQLLHLVFAKDADAQIIGFLQHRYGLRLADSNQRHLIFIPSASFTGFSYIFFDGCQILL